MNARPGMPTSLFTAVCATAAFLLPGCGGGASGDPLSPTANVVVPPSGSSTGPFVQEQLAAALAKPVAGQAEQGGPAAAPASCDTAPAVPASVPGDAINVKSFGAVPNDDIDDSYAIQQALSAVKPGQWVYFPPGRYDHVRALNLRVPDVTLWGYGATLNATTPADQSLTVRADRDRVYGFTFHATTDYRRTEIGSARLVSDGREAASGYISGVVFQDNKVVPATTQPNTDRSNSASSAGIFIYASRFFTVANNLVSRSLADGIHVTGRSRDGRIIGNTVTEAGDDMIAIVTYMPSTWRASAVADSTWISDYLTSARVRNVLIKDNTVNGQYWGRGIAVVGGESVTIQNNQVDNATYGAGILVARENNYNTTGVENVLISGNRVNAVQTTTPAYVPTGANFTKLASNLSKGTTGQGGIEIYNTSPDSDPADPTLKPAIQIKSIQIDNNTVTGTLGDGIRVGRFSPAGSIEDVAISNNRLSSIGKLPIGGYFSNDTFPKANCSANLTGDLKAVTSAICSLQTKPKVTGAALECSKF